MAWLFSKRCRQALNEGKIKVSIPVPVRRRLWKALIDYDDYCVETTETGFNYQTSVLKKIPEKLKGEIGFNEFLAFPEQGEGPPVSSDLEGFLLRGNYPPHLFDISELFFEGNAPDKRTLFQTRFNEIMEESNLPWRMAEGKVFPADSVYIEEHILRRSQELLHSAKFQGSLKEFEKARVDLINGDFEGAIQNANLAVESVIKEILKINQARPGELYRKIIESGLIPEYYDGFLKTFETHTLRCVAIVRNQEQGVGHGKGPSKNEVPKELAELAVNFSAVLINYLVKRSLRQI